MNARKYALSKNLDGSIQDYDRAEVLCRVFVYRVILEMSLQDAQKKLNVTKHTIEKNTKILCEESLWTRRISLSMLRDIVHGRLTKGVRASVLSKKIITTALSGKRLPEKVKRMISLNIKTMIYLAVRRGNIKAFSKKEKVDEGAVYCALGRVSVKLTREYGCRIDGQISKCLAYLQYLSGINHLSKNGAMNDKARDAFSQNLRVAYENGFSMQALADFLCCSTNTIQKHLRMANADIRSPSWRGELIKSNNRRYHVDETFFDTLTPVSAYLLGFFFADGDLMVKNGKPQGIRLRVSERDKDILILLKKTIKTDAEIKQITSNNKLQWELSIYSMKLADVLKEYGVISNRAINDISPNLGKIPKYLHKYFWLGVFDGDGHIQRSYKSKFKLSGLNVGLSGNKKTLSLFLRFVKENCLKKFKRTDWNMKIEQNGNSLVCYKVVFDGPKAVEVLRILYEHNKIQSLGRKRKIAVQIVRAYRDCLANGLDIANNENKIIYIGKNNLSNKCKKSLGLINYSLLKSRRKKRRKTK